MLTLPAPIGPADAVAVTPSPPGTALRRALDAAIARLPAPDADWDSRVTFGPVSGPVSGLVGGLGVGAATLSDLAADPAALAVLVAAKQSQARGGDAKLGCAYLIGDVAWAVSRVMAGLWLAGWHLRGVAPRAVALRPRPVSWEADGRSGTVHVLDLTIDPDGLEPGPDDPGLFARAMVDLHAGLVQALVPLTGLGAPAQWRLVADGLSGAILQQGRAMDRMADALTLGRAIMSDRATRLWAKQAAYVELRAAPDLSDWFRLRAGCCRYYTAAGESGAYCATCVHRDRDDQIDRLRAQLLGSRGAG